MAVDVIVDGFVVVDGAVDMSATLVDDSACANRTAGVATAAMIAVDSST